MCGIAGMFRFDKEPAKSDIVQRMTNCMSHRGPDADGFYAEGPVALGHRRLSIIDLSEAANQPIADNNGRYQIIFNGEIYNFKEVKALLPEYEFKTAGDTEVLLAAYGKWGADCLAYLKGMFVFIIWDTQTRELFIARDRMGVKPVYYFQNDSFFLFASEIRGILATGLVKPELNREAITEFLSFQSIGGTDSIIKGISQLPAASFLRIRNNNVSIEKYWNFDSDTDSFDFDNSKAVHKKIRDLFAASVERRLISDVPLGAFLSGGIDSSAVVGMMAEVSTARPNTFTIGFDEKDFDESEYASIIAKKFNTIHERLLVKPSLFLDELPNALNAMDTPSGDGVNTYAVSKAIRKSGVTVALSGVGGDELFAGYPFFNKYLQIRKFDLGWRLAKPLRYATAAAISTQQSVKTDRLSKLLRAPSNTIDYVYPEFRRIISSDLLSRLTKLESGTPHITKELIELKNVWEKFPLLSQVSIAEYTGYTQHTLLKDTDQMSMAVSLEVREPFFDHDLVSFVLRVPDDLKKGSYPKSLLVESLGDLLPSEIVHRKKQGFLFPWSVWMKNELRDFCDQRIRAVAKRDFIQHDELIKYWNKFLSNDPSVRWMELWLFVILEEWLEKNNIN
ncbi:MAG: asparagine synthase (glutamine-hydrolyzing) [Chitinophagaceae bacterium]|nr:asparagine synthase (glutamine-hydrolyzing) [Chitinophagaceae bacterium]